MQQATTRNEYYSTEKAAKYLGLAGITLRKWRMAGQGPAFIKIGRCIRYKRADLEAWMDAHRVGSRA